MTVDPNKELDRTKGTPAKMELLFAGQSRSPTLSAVLIPWASLLAALVLMAGCSPPGVPAPVVTITNQSSLLLSNVVVSGTGFSERVGSVGAGARTRAAVHPTGSTGLRITFDAGDHHVDSGQQGYFDATHEYRVSATVKTDLTVSVSSRLVKRHVQEAVPTLSNLTHLEEGGRRIVTLDFLVPPGMRASVTKSQLVIDYGTAWAVRGAPSWTSQSDPSGRVYGPGTKSTLRLIEPPQRLIRLQLEMVTFEAGPRVWLWKLKRCWQTKSLSALRRGPPPKIFVLVQSEPFSTYGSERGDPANRSLPVDH